MKLDFASNTMATEIQQVIDEEPDMTRDSDQSEAPIVKPTKRKAKAKKAKKKKSKKAKYNVSSSESSSEDSEDSEASDSSE